MWVVIENDRPLYYAGSIVWHLTGKCGQLFTLSVCTGESRTSIAGTQHVHLSLTLDLKARTTKLHDSQARAKNDRRYTVKRIAKWRASVKGKCNAARQTALVAYLHEIDICTIVIVYFIT